MTFTRSTLAALCSVALLASACGGDATDEEAGSVETTTTVEATTTTDEVTSTSEAPTSETSTGEASTSTTAETTAETSETGFPGTPVAAFLSQAYLFGSEQGVPSDDQLPFPPDTVTAHWYQSEGFYVVVYGALDPSLVLCPGNSIQTPTGFVNVSNAPLNGADCSFAPSLASAPNGVVTCNRMVAYVTLIPAGTEGVLFGTIETMTDGLGIGLTSQVAADPANMPEIARDLIDC